MFIDNLTLMLINMVAALIVHALYMGWLKDRDPKMAIPGYLITGAIAAIAGFHMVFSWPLPGSYNIIYGEMSVFLGMFFFGAGIAIAFGWSLITVGIPAFLAGAASILLGIRILNLNLTSEPIVAALGFVATGATAMLTLPVFVFPKQKWLQILVVIGALGSALVWIFVGYPAYWQHIDAFSKWAPK